jgi:hypothetical protein
VATRLGLSGGYFRVYIRVVLCNLLIFSFHGFLSAHKTFKFC